MKKFKKLINKPRNELNDKEEIIVFFINILIAPIIIIIPAIPAIFIYCLAHLSGLQSPTLFVE